MNYIPLGGGVITDDATATASQILSGYTAYVKGKKITGSIQSQNGQTITPMSSIQVIHTKDKYLTGDITVKGDSSLLAGNIRKGATIFGISGTYTSDANATAAYILSGKTAYVNGSKVTGTMPNQSASIRTITTDTGNQTLGCFRYYSNYLQIVPGKGYWGSWSWNASRLQIAQSVLASAIGLSAAKIARGNTILGIAGTYTGTVSSTCVILSHQNYDYNDAAQFTINGNMCSHVSTNKGVVTFKFNVSGRVYVRSTFFKYADSDAVASCSLNGWVDVTVGKTFTITTTIGSAGHGNNKRSIAAVSISM